MKRESESKETLSRRNFFTKCGVAVVATAACELLSVFSTASAEQTRLCTQCNSFCVTSCTSSTCVNQRPPEVPPPTCVQGFK
jgi:hypothetical protein